MIGGAVDAGGREGEVGGDSAREDAGGGVSLIKMGKSSAVGAAVAGEGEGGGGEGEGLKEPTGAANAINAVSLCTDLANEVCNAAWTCEFVGLIAKGPNNAALTDV
jgi:hypothetical protein